MADKADNILDIDCPACENTMVKKYSDYTKEIQVDYCYHCGGKFLIIVNFKE